MDFAAFSSQPRGLHNFISEIRNCKNKDDERMRVDKELANIRSKFATPANLTSYDKKKYVWKLCYIYMLGYEVDFGHVEFISLLSSTKFQEKSVGYMAFSMMFRPGDELMTLAVNSMRNDIVGPFNAAQTLALAAVSNMGGNDLAEALSGDVQRLIVSPLESVPSYSLGQNAENEFRNKSQLCKKASICLLRLFRTNPECVILDEWMKRLAKLLEDRDVGVLTSILSLLLAFASYSPAIFEPLVPYVISVLTRLVVNRTCPADYLYYHNPSPWIQVKCLRFLQYYKIPEDRTQVDLLQDIMSKILIKTEVSESNNKSNADHSVLFEAINLVIIYGSECPAQLRDLAADLLGKFISTKDANTRYLGIETMTRFAKLEGPQVAEQYQTDVLDSLKDPDISLRKRALNLLYVMTYEKNARDIVGELVVSLPQSDNVIKEDIVVKIAILAEKYSHNYQWYLDTMIQVILLAGDYVAEAVWYRIVQVVINNSDIHEYAAEKLLTSVQSKYAHEIVVAVAAYLLGEIGVNICEKSGMTGYDQFVALHQHFANASLKTQSLMLTTYVKLLNLYPDQIRDLVIEVFNKHSTSSQLELQQRSCEYIALSGISPDTVETVLNTMPPFPLDEKENILLSIESSEGKSADRSAWSVDQGEKEASRAAYQDSRNARPSEKAANEPTFKKPTETVTAAVDLLSLDDFSSPSSGPSTGLSAAQAEQLRKQLRNAYLTKGLNAKTTLVENDIVQISISHDYRAHQGRLVLAIYNKGNYELRNLQFDFPSTEAINIRTQGPAQRVSQGDEARVQIAVECLKPFTELPPATLTFSIEYTNYSYEIPLPVTVGSFSVPLPSDKTTFMNRWKAITAENTEAQEVFLSGRPINPDLMNFIRGSFMPAISVAQVTELDNEKTFTGSTTFMTGTVGPEGKPIAVGALLRLEGEPNHNKFRITVRATHPTVSLAIKSFIVSQLS